MNATVNVYLSFNGTCEEAFRVYERLLGGAVTFMLTWGNSPMAAGAPAAWRDKINHATLQIGGTRIQGADALPGHYQPPAGYSMVLQLDDSAAAERIFDELAAGGRVDMPLQETFWAYRFGTLTDRFGISWSINCEKDMAAS